MTIPTSVLAELVNEIPQLKPQIYFKSSLTALSHAMEDQVLVGQGSPLVIATFQREGFYRQEAHRYKRIGRLSEQVYVLAAPEAEFKNSSGDYETVAFDPKDTLSLEWNLVAIAEEYSTCLICNERQGKDEDLEEGDNLTMDRARRFEGIWTSDRQVCYEAAALLLRRILEYRPELIDKVKEVRKIYGIPTRRAKKRKSSKTSTRRSSAKSVKKAKTVAPDLQLSDPFAQRLVTYLQAGEHKLLKAYRSIAARERQERLVNVITAAMRRSLDPKEIIEVTVKELGVALSACRCLIYQCFATDNQVSIEHEYLGPSVTSLRGQTWPLKNNPLFQKVVRTQGRVYIRDTTSFSKEEMEEFAINLEFASKDILEEPQNCVPELISKWNIVGWLMVPVLYQGRLLGILEFHDCGSCPNLWSEDGLNLIEAIATQLGATLIQAETYGNLEELNQQLEALERTRSNLIAITGHELRTPLSTIQVCLESLSQEPDMPAELQQVMLETALTDAERMRKLVQDFLTLSDLESNRVQWNLESLRLQECIDLALSSVRIHQLDRDLPKITTKVPKQLPLVLADGERLVEVISKLLDNACKFTPANGKVTVEAKTNGGNMLEVIVSDNGRGIEPGRLEVIFDRFYQEEGALRRTVGGTGLGLAICRQIITRLGGKIWAESAGKDKGSEFHFTIKIAENGQKSNTKTTANKRYSSNRQRRKKT